MSSSAARPRRPIRTGVPSRLTQELETEAKFRIPSARAGLLALREAARLVPGCSLREGQRVQSIDVYLDTSDRRLLNQGSSLRLRAEGSKPVCVTLKTYVAAAGLRGVVREETEVTGDGEGVSDLSGHLGQLGLFSLELPSSSPNIRQLVTQESLRVLTVIEQLRRRFEIVLGDRARGRVL